MNVNLRKKICFSICLARRRFKLENHVLVANHVEANGTADINIFIENVLNIAETIENYFKKICLNMFFLCVYHLLLF